MTDPLRVAFVLPSLAGGGAEKVMLSVASGIGRERFRPTLVVLNADGPLRHAVPDTLDLVDLKSPRLRSGLAAMFSLFRQRRFDVIVSTMGYMNMGILLGGTAGTGGAKVIVREANTPDATLDSFPFPLLGKIGYRFLYKRAAAVVCNAAAVKAGLVQLGVPEKQVLIVPNPVDIEGLRRDTQRLRHPGSGRRFVAVGRLTHQKGYDRLIPIMRNGRPDDHLTILGEGPLRAQLEADLRDAGLTDRVHMPGFVENPEPIVAGADAFLMPSRWEGMPNAALESLALGTPVIASSGSGGLVELQDEVPNARLSIADSELAFERLVQNVEPSPEQTGLRPVGLPERFSKPSVISAFEALIGT